MTPETITYTEADAKAAAVFLKPRPPLRAPLLARLLDWLATALFPRLRDARAALLAERTKRIEAEASADYHARDAAILRGICDDLRKRAQDAEGTQNTPTP